MSNARLTAERTDAAARWAVRLDSASLSAADQAALETWLAQDRLNKGALLRAQATLAYLDRGRALGADVATLEVTALRAEAGTAGRRRFLKLSVGGAATLAAGLGALSFLPRLNREEIGTRIGEVRRVPLADGSVAVLNTASRIAVALQSTQRGIRLDKGEAWFQVAHDKTRPFVVEAGSVRVRAVGTAFAVRRRAEGADVLVTEGVVETWIEGREGCRRRLAAGSRSYVAAGPQSSDLTVENQPQEVDRALAWRSGEMALNGETIDYAVAELNRYNLQRIVIADPAIGQERVVGYFRTNEPAKFAWAVADMTGAHVVEKGNEILLAR